MGKRRKNRTHLKGPNNSIAGPENGPKSFIIKHGQVGSSITQLVRDVRKVLEPNTASRLKERSRNKLKDYLVLAPALQVTHIIAFTLTPISPSLRIVRLSDGPTLSFRVEKYSLMKDISSSKRTSRSIGLEYLSPPLLVLSSFPTQGPPHLSLLLKAFQSLFPPLSPKQLSLSSARRVVLIAYNPEQGTVDWRHFIITVKPVGVSKRVRKLVEGAPPSSTHHSSVLDLGSEKDIADFLLRKKGEPSPSDAGYESAASSGASDVEGASINLADDYVGRNNKKGQRRAVRLDEVGPRLELRLTKITEGVPGKDGKVIFHEFITKSKKETQAQDKDHQEREQLRKQRRAEQERNVDRKKALSTKKGKGKDAEEHSEPEDEEEEQEEEQDEVEVDGVWDGDEEIEESDDEPDVSQAEDSSESEDELEAPPPKKARLKGKR